jgi:hypothetical protein
MISKYLGTNSENVYGLSHLIGGTGYDFIGYDRPTPESYFIVKPKIPDDETYISDVPDLNFGELQKKLQKNIFEPQEPIDYDFRLYPSGDKSFGDFIPGISEVQLPAFSFVKEENILPTFVEEQNEEYED